MSNGKYLILFILLVLHRLGEGGFIPPLLSPDSVFAAQSSSRGGNFVVYAPDQQSADFASIAAERVLAGFNQLFELSPAGTTSPIVLAVGSSRGNNVEEQGTVRVFPREGMPKIQVNWDETPLHLESFVRGWVRALCVRQTIAAMVDSREKRAGELRVPFWITEGVAAQLSDSGQMEEILSRAALLARLEPNLSLEDVFVELEGNPRLDANERSLAFVLCRALLQDSSAKKRFFGELNWTENRRPSAWVASVGGVEDAHSWWNEVWKMQSSQFSWRKLGFGPTLACILLFEKSTTSWLAVPFLSANKMEMPPFTRENIASIAHPWFKDWFAERESYSKSPMRTRQEGEARRKLALKWFGQFGPDANGMTREDYLSWGTWESERVRSPSLDGPVEDWFDSCHHVE